MGSPSPPPAHTAKHNVGRDTQDRIGYMLHDPRIHNDTGNDC